MNIFTTKDYEEIVKRYNLGYPIKKSEQYEYRRCGGTRKCGIKFVYTQEELLEYAKCASDIIYFIEKYCKVMTESGMGQIKLYGYQKEVIRNYQENRFNILYTSRQVGLTLLMSLIFLHQMTFNIDKTITCMDIKNEHNKIFIKKIKNTYRGLPFFLKQGIRKWKNTILEFENGSRITSMTSSKNLAVGYGIDNLYISNFSRIRHNEFIYDSLVPIISARSNAKFIIQSGPNGAGFLYDLVRDSERPNDDPNKNIFKTQRIHWWDVPGRDEKWKNEMIKLYGIDVWNEEFDFTIIVSDKKKKRKNG